MTSSSILPESAGDNDAAQAPSSSSNAPIRSRKLSTVSLECMTSKEMANYIDEAEIAMRQMDTSERGYLTNEKVYQIMQEHVQTQRQLFQFKKITIGWFGLAISRSST